MGVLIDLTGLKYDRLTVLGLFEIKNHKAYWNCRCDCGNEKPVYGCDMKKGKIKSCGCLRDEQRLKHGHSRRGAESAEHSAWRHMISRCTNPNSHAYKDYGGRGIIVSEDWFSYEIFLKDMGERPTNKHTLERIDNNKGYCKENCKWATMKDQNNNQRRSRFLQIDGVTKTLSQWAESAGIRKTTLFYRINNGWNPKDAVFSR